MVLALIYFDATDPDGFLGALEGEAELLEHVDGFYGLDIHRGIENPNRFLLTARWESVEAHTAWQAANAEEFLWALKPFMSGEPDIKHFQ